MSLNHACDICDAPASRTTLENDALGNPLFYLCEACHEAMEAQGRELTN